MTAHVTGDRHDWKRTHSPQNPRPVAENTGLYAWSKNRVTRLTLFNMSSLDELWNIGPSPLTEATLKAESRPTGRAEFEALRSSLQLLCSWAVPGRKGWTPRVPRLAFRLMASWPGANEALQEKGVWCVLDGASVLGPLQF